MAVPVEMKHGSTVVKKAFMNYSLIAYVNQSMKKKKHEVEDFPILTN